MFIEELKKRRVQLSQLIDYVTKELEGLPLGNLRIQSRNNSPQYFHVTKAGGKQGTYIKAENRGLAAELAKRSYYEKFLREAMREYKAISAYLRGMRGISAEDVYSGMNPLRKAIVEPILISDEDYAARWETAPYEKNPYNPEECIHPTEKGDLVRSKSEARIADMYYALGIHYRYEAPLRLKNGKIKYPDFTILKFPERIEYYHEHMGCMDDEGYRAKNLVKLSEYAESGILTGKNLILTFEADYAPLNIKVLRKNVTGIFIP